MLLILRFGWYTLAVFTADSSVMKARMIASNREVQLLASGKNIGLQLPCHLVRCM